jgi:hypothetical protein
MPTSEAQIEAATDACWKAMAKAAAPNGLSSDEREGLALAVLANTCCPVHCSPSRRTWPR